MFNVLYKFTKVYLIYHIFRTQNQLNGKWGEKMFNLPPETFWLVVPWPFIWLTAGIIMYFVNKRKDELEDEYYANLDKKE